MAMPIQGATSCVLTERRTERICDPATPRVWPPKRVPFRLNVHSARKLLIFAADLEAGMELRDREGGGEAAGGGNGIKRWRGRRRGHGRRRGRGRRRGMRLLALPRRCLADRRHLFRPVTHDLVRTDREALMCTDEAEIGSREGEEEEEGDAPGGGEGTSAAVSRYEDFVPAPVLRRHGGA